MTRVLLETQLLVVAFMFVLAVLGKLHAPKDKVRILYVLVESTLVVLLLVSTHPLVRLATATLMISATWVLGEMRTLRPGQGCGCFGVLSSSPVTRMTVLRTGLLALAAIAAFPVERTGLEILADLPGWRSLLFMAEVGLIAAISPEISMAIRRQRTPCERRFVPLRETLAVLHASEPWRRHGLSRKTEPVEVWRELCWRFFVYPLEGGERGEVVFVVSLADGQVRAAPVDAELSAMPRGDLALARSSL
ncbi:MauE/DoxX family redox-associated membrane protein [Actinocorallia sp. B10E7]|uniref:MauE/DoxX family redox-associated membrane protein n=1 Tax=Actinocorallia sp. B10E7 TaxID=3153558 RepID=UPI00325CFC76